MQKRIMVTSFSQVFFDGFSRDELFSLRFLLGGGVVDCDVAARGKRRVS